MEGNREAAAEWVARAEAALLESDYARALRLFVKAQTLYPLEGLATKIESAQAFQAQHSQQQSQQQQSQQHGPQPHKLASARPGAVCAPPGGLGRFLAIVISTKTKLHAHVASYGPRGALDTYAIS